MWLQTIQSFDWSKWRCALWRSVTSRLLSRPNVITEGPSNMLSIRQLLRHSFIFHLRLTFFVQVWKHNLVKRMFINPKWCWSIKHKQSASCTIFIFKMGDIKYFVILYKKALLRPQKNDLLFLRHFFENTNARGRNFFLLCQIIFFLFLSR